MLRYKSIRVQILSGKNFPQSQNGLPRGKRVKNARWIINSRKHQYKKMMQPNPWLSIPAEIYDRHMASSGVMQTQLLNRIMAEQIHDYVPNKLLILGVATGNGLELVSKISRVYAADVNHQYLDICRRRFAHLHNVEYLQMDFMDNFVVLPPVDLVIANLFVEYIDLSVFFEKFQKCLVRNGTISIVIQENPAGKGMISVSDYSRSFEILQPLIRERSQEEIQQCAIEHGFLSVRTARHTLPSGKSLIRLDFQN